MPNAVVKHYHSEMVGAPQLTYQAGSLIGVLDAVLVNGWGAQTATSIVIAGGVATVSLPASHPFELEAVAKIEGATPAGLNGEQKVTGVVGNTFTFNTALADQTASGTITVSLPPLGFEKSFSGTNLAAYKIIDPEFVTAYLRINDSASYNAKAIAYATMSDIDTGTGQFPTTAQLSGGLNWIKANNTTGTRKWYIVGTGGTVLVGISHHSSGDMYGFQMFGAFKSNKVADQYNIAVSGCESATAYSGEAGGHQTGSFSRIDNVSTYANFYVMREYLGITESLKCQHDLQHKISGDGTMYCGDATRPPYPNALASEIAVTPLLIREGTSRAANFRGTVPGWLWCLNYLSSNAPLNKEVITAETSDSEVSGRKLVALNVIALTARQFVDISGPWST